MADVSLGMALAELNPIKSSLENTNPQFHSSLLDVAVSI